VAVPTEVTIINYYWRIRAEIMFLIFKKLPSNSGSLDKYNTHMSPIYQHIKQYEKTYTFSQ